MSVKLFLNSQSQNTTINVGGQVVDITYENINFDDILPKGYDRFRVDFYLKSITTPVALSAFIQIQLVNLGTILTADSTNTNSGIIGCVLPTNYTLATGATIRYFDTRTIQSDLTIFRPKGNELRVRLLNATSGGLALGMVHYVLCLKFQPIDN